MLKTREPQIRSMEKIEYTLFIRFIDGSEDIHKWIGLEQNKYCPNSKIFTPMGVNYMVEDGAVTFSPWHQVKRASYTTKVIEILIKEKD